MVDMASQISTKIRLVRCPRCENVLPEWPNIPLYQCGGCGAVLQAKNGRNDPSSSESNSHRTSSSQENKNETHPRSSGQEATTVYLETSPESENKRDQTEIGNHNTEKPCDLNASDEILGSTELSSLGNGKFCLVEEESTEQDEHKSSLGLDDRKYGNVALDHNRDQSAENNSVDELSCSHELGFYENEESSPLNREPQEQQEDSRSLDKAGEYGNESQDGRREGEGDRKFFSELPSSSRLICHTIETSTLGGTSNDKLDMENNMLEQYDKRDQDEFRDQRGESLKDLGDLSSSDELLGSTKLCNLGNDKLCSEDKESAEQNARRSSLGQDDRTYGKMALDHNNDRSGERNSFGEELPYPYEFSFRLNDESSLQSRGPSKQDEDEHSLKNSGESENEYQDGRSKEMGDGMFPAELRSSDSFSFHTVQASSSGCTGCNKLKKRDDTLEQDDGRDQDEHRDQKGESLEVNIFLATILPPHLSSYHQNELSAGGRAEREGDESRFLPQQNNDKNQHNFAGRIEVSSNDVSFPREASTSTVVAFHKVKKSSIEVKAFINMDKDQISNFASSDVGPFTPKRGEAIVADRTTLSESILPENLSPRNKDLEQSQNVVQGVGHASFLDASESPTLNPRPELGTLSKSPTRDLYDCDASVSSYEGTEDQFFEQCSPLGERKFRATGFISTKKSSRMNRCGVKKLQNRELDVQRRGTDFSSTSRGGNTRGITGGNSILHQSPELRRYDRAIRSKTGLDKHVHGCRKPYNCRSSQFIPRDGSPSNYPHVYQQQSGFSSPDTTSSQEPAKRQLLRMVRELEYKLKQTNISRRTTNGKSFAGNLGKKKHTPIHHDDLATEAPSYADFRVSRYPRQSKMSGGAFPGEAAHCRHQVDCLCSCRCRAEWQCLAQFPSHSIHCCGQYMKDPIRSCHNAFPSCYSSPQAYISSEVSPQGRGTKANYRKHKEHEPKRLYTREKHNQAKRHLVPVAGGSPIIACCNCSVLLQLPGDFPLFKRRCYHLRCNSCKRITKFSLRKGSHLVPYILDAPAPPPSRDG